MLLRLLLIAFVMPTYTYNTADTTHTWKDGTKVGDVACYGAGARGGEGSSNTVGGGGGAYSAVTGYSRSGNTLALSIPAQNSGDDCYAGDGSVVLAKSPAAYSATGGAAGSGVGTTKFSGGDGATGAGGDRGGGAGAGAAAGGDGNDGDGGSGTTGGAGGVGPGGNGGNGADQGGDGQSGTLPGGGGGGSDGGTAEGLGAAGQITVTTANGNLNVTNQPDNANSGDAQTVEVTVRNSDNTTSTTAYGSYTIEVASGSISITGGTTTISPSSGVLTFSINVSGSGAGTLRIYGSAGTATDAGLDVNTASFTITGAANTLKSLALTGVGG